MCYLAKIAVVATNNHGNFCLYFVDARVDQKNAKYAKVVFVQYVFLSVKKEIVKIAMNSFTFPFPALLYSSAGNFSVNYRLTKN